MTNLRLSAPDNSALAKRRTGLNKTETDLQKLGNELYKEDIADSASNMTQVSGGASTCSEMARFVTGVHEADTAALAFALTGIEGT